MPLGNPLLVLVPSTSGDGQELTASDPITVYAVYDPRRTAKSLYALIVRSGEYWTAKLALEARGRGGYDSADTALAAIQAIYDSETENERL